MFSVFCIYFFPSYCVCVCVCPKGFLHWLWAYMLLRIRTSRSVILNDLELYLPSESLIRMNQIFLQAMAWFIAQYSTHNSLLTVLEEVLTLTWGIHLCRHACSRFWPRSLFYNADRDSQAGRLQHYQLWDCQSCQTPHFSMSSQSCIHLNVVKVCHMGKLRTSHNLLKGQWQTMDVR